MSDPGTHAGGKRARRERAFEVQLAICERMDAPLYSELLRRCRADVSAGGPIDRLLRGFDGDPVKGWLPLRLLGGVHALAIAGEAPELARSYPTLGGAPTWPDTWHRFVEVAERSGDALERALARFPQTNEVGRAAPLLGGFLTASAHTRLPLRILELGASAGLNLRFDRYRYALGPHRFGDPAARVHVECEWEGPAPPLDAGLQVATRAGCDLAPIDVDDPHARLALLGYVWADHPERFARLRSALELARNVPTAIDRERAGEWIERQLREPVSGVATVVYHSSVWAYLDRDERAQVTSAIERAGERATAEAPLVWQRLEDPEPRIDLRQRTWPGGADVILADAHVHGRWIRWHASGSA